MQQRQVLYTTLTLLALISSSCLKTRAQLKGERDDDEGDRRPVAAQVQNIEPQGGYAIDEIKSEMTRLNGRIEDLERAQKQGASQGSAAQKEEIKRLETRISELESAQANLIEVVKKVQSVSAASDPNEILEKGKRAFQGQEFEEAIEFFTSYLQAPKAKKAEEATFLRAESHYRLNQFKKAILDYSKIQEKYPQSERMPASLYRTGLCFDALGMKDDAKGFYQELKERFPKSAEAKKLSAKPAKSGKKKR